MEIVDLLETLDTDDDVPEGMQRRRGQDNFNQREYLRSSLSNKDQLIDFVFFAANEPRLARQQEEMKSAWDQELEAIASDRKVSKNCDCYSPAVF